MGSVLWLRSACISSECVFRETQSATNTFTHYCSPNGQFSDSSKSAAMRHTDSSNQSSIHKWSFCNELLLLRSLSLRLSLRLSGLSGLRRLSGLILLLFLLLRFRVGHVHFHLSWVSIVLHVVKIASLGSLALVLKDYKCIALFESKDDSLHVANFLEKLLQSLLLHECVWSRHVNCSLHLLLGQSRLLLLGLLLLLWFLVLLWLSGRVLLC
mmetsp:Transcript_3737/g.14186  ORF Transcript_3737/g.14186 Transcript_3737/m.14186 type:complete len:212 (-) Transcript_3737:498-1133(-)